MKIKKIEINIRAKTKPFWEKIGSQAKGKYLKDTVNHFLLIPAIVFLVAAWVFAIYYFQPNEYLVPLRYSSFLGVSSLGRWYELYLLPLSLTLCFVINVSLARVIYERDKFVGYILTAANIFLALVSLIIIINFGRIIG